jgi:hypothetical protein
MHLFVCQLLGANHAYFASCPSGSVDAGNRSSLRQKFGQHGTLSEETVILAMLEHSENGVGRKAKGSELVVNVCSMRGRWIYLEWDWNFEKIRIQVTDGEITCR